jgi:HlyD family secretion protein
MKFNLSNRKNLLMILGGLVIVAAVAGYVFWGRRAAADEYITAKIERGNVRNTVNATGTLQAVTTVQVGSQVSGNISALYVDFNSNVSKGQVVAQLDPSVLQAQVAQQRANLEQARANLADAQARVIAAESAIESQRAGVSSAAANLEALKAQRDDARNNYQRQESLATSGLINQRELETARANLQAAEARFNQANAQLAQARANEQQAARAGLAQAQAAVKQATAQVQQTQASLQMAEVNLSHTTIHSPIDGVVVSRNVDVGQTVAASLQAPTLFTIANDLTQMQVIANIDQADIGVINSSNRINFTVDAYPGQNFGGAIRQIRLNPQNVQNVVTYNVVIDVENPDLKLKPGMTANLTVTIAERQDVLKVPNAALRFRPSDVTQEKLRELMQNARNEQKPQEAQQAEQSKRQGEQAVGGGERGRGARQGESQANAGERGPREGGRRREGSPGATGPGGGGRPGEQQAGAGEGGSREGWRRREGGPGATGPGGSERQGERQAGAGERGSREGWRRREGGPGATGPGGSERQGERQAGAGEGGSREGWRRREGAPGATGPGESGRQGERQASAGERAPRDSSRRREGAGAAGGSGASGAGAGGSGMMQTAAVLQGQIRIVWVLGPDGKPQPRWIRLGITDGANTEIADGNLKEGELIITAQNVTGESRPQSTQRPPGFGGGFGGGGGRGPR